MLLDEPTNHLDAESIDWLEQHLQQYKGTVIAVTHDRYFLDNVAGWILELDRGEGIPWKGNYSGWLEQKTEPYGYGGEAGIEAPQDTRTRVGVGAHVALRPVTPRRKARLSAYDKQMLNEDAKQEREEKLEIFIPNGPRLGDVVIEAHARKEGLRRPGAVRATSTSSLPPAGIVGVIGPNGSGQDYPLPDDYGTRIRPTAGTFDGGCRPSSWPTLTSSTSPSTRKRPFTR